MATGHTYRIIDGEVNNAREFAAECAKSFVWAYGDTGRLTYPEVQPFYLDAIQKDLKELAKWDSLDEEGRYAKWSNYVNDLESKAKEVETDAAELHSKLQDIYNEVASIDVPETHANFKNFMLDQLKSTMDFDATFEPKYYETQDYSTWCDAQRGYILDSLNHHANALKKEQERVDESRKWISTLARLFDLEVK